MISPVTTSAERGRVKFEASKHLQFVYILADIQEGFLVDAQAILRKIGELRFQVAQDIEFIKKKTQIVQEDLTTAIPMNERIHFGEVSDNIKNEFEKLLRKILLHEEIPVDIDEATYMQIKSDIIDDLITKFNLNISYDRDYIIGALENAKQEIPQ